MSAPRLSAVFPFQEMLCQEASDGFIVELQAEPRQQDASNDDGRALGWKESLFFTHA